MVTDCVQRKVSVVHVIVKELNVFVLTFFEEEEAVQNVAVL